MKQNLPGGQFVDLDLSGLQTLLLELKANYYTDIGVLGSSGGSRSEGITIAGIGAVHEFGYLEKNIKKRSFIVMPLNRKKAMIESYAWKSFNRNASIGKIKEIFKDIGIACEVAIQEAFETGGFGEWPDIEQATKDAKGSSAILINEGTLRKSISSRVGQ